MWALGLAMWGACSPGPTHPSIIDDVQVISIVADPPEGIPGQSIQLQATVLDPLARGVDVLIWTCAAIEGRCAEEAGFEGNPGAWLTVTPLTGDTIGTTRQIPTETADVMDELALTTLSTGVLVLACPPGQCPLISQAREAILTGVIGDALGKDLADPMRWMGSVPVAGVSLTARTFVISRSSDGSQNTNPTVDARFAARDDDPIVIDPGGDQEFSFLVEDLENDRIYAYAYTTVGQFEERREREYDGVVRHYLLAPQEAGDGHAYIVFEDDGGGAAVWSRAISVR